MASSLPIVALLLLVSCGSTSVWLNVATDICNETVILEVLSVGHSVCTDSYTRLTSDLFDTSYTLAQLKFAAEYLCGIHCGAYFYQAAYQGCNGNESVTNDFLQLHCAQFEIDEDDDEDDDIIYCAIMELFINYEATSNLSDCLINCTNSCYNTLANITSSATGVGCCLTERYLTSFAFLRNIDADRSPIFSSVLSVCEIETSYCEPAYVDGIPVFTDEDDETSSKSFQLKGMVNYSTILALFTGICYAWK